MESENHDKFHTVQAHRDLESNWGVDLAKNLEDYLLKICSGEIFAEDDAHFSVNFAEAALLLQGSIQVYSRKVEYLYNLVLHALEFISQTRSQDNVESTSVQPEASSSRAVHDEDDHFWISDDVPVDGKNCLDNVTSKDTSLDHFVKPPANLVVHEGDCLDSTDDGGELESFLLATNNLYCDFILLDPCDAVAVDEFLKDNKSDDKQHNGYRGSSLMSKAHKSFFSPARHSGGTTRRSSTKKGLDNLGEASPFGDASKMPNDNFEPGPDYSFADHGNFGFESDDNNPQHENFGDSDDDDDDPWKPLNPHEPGNLKVKRFRKVKALKRKGMMKNFNVASQFPLAKLHGAVSPELTGIWELHFCARNRQDESKPIPLYEKLRQSLVEEHPNHGTFCPPENGDAEGIFDDGINDFDQPDFDMPDVNYMDEQVDFEADKYHDFVSDVANANHNDDPSSQPSLEDLCRSHLDTLLASIAENEKQTELAARVSSWKQRTEQDLEKEDSRPPFDIHEYGELVLDRLSLGEAVSAVAFTDVVKGQEKHDIARTFSALLQLVNDRKVDLERSTSTSDSFCYTAVNPFHLRLLGNAKGPKKMQFQFTKKRQKSPINQERNEDENDHLSRKSSVFRSGSLGSKSRAILSQPNCKYDVEHGKGRGLRCTPDRKRRRRSELVESTDFSSAR